MSGNVGSAIFGSGMVENVGVAVGIASKSVSVQKLFPLPVCGRHLSFRCRPMSDNVIFGSGILENMGVAVGIALKSVSVQKLFPLPVCGRHLSFRCRPMSHDVGQCRQCHILVGRGRKYRGSRWNRFEICFRSKVISTSGFYFRFRGRRLSFRCLDNVDSVTFGSGMVENMGVTAEIASSSCPSQTLFLVQVWRLPF